MSTIAAIIAALDRPADPQAAPKPDSEESQTELKLLALDVQEAEANLQAATADMNALEMLFKKGTVSDLELQSKKLKVQVAKIALERARLKLDAARANQEAKPTQPRILPSPMQSR